MVGKAKELTGNVKEAVGRLTGDETLEAEGEAEKHAGRAERKAAGAVQEASSTIEQGVGRLTEPEDPEPERQAEKKAGRLERS